MFQSDFLNNLREKYKKPVIVFLVLFFAVIAVIIASGLTPTKPLPGTEIDRKEILKNPGIEIVLDPTIKFPDIPDSLPAYYYRRIELDPIPIASALAYYFKFTKSETVSGLWTGSDGFSYVNVNNLNKYIDYSVDQTQNPDLFSGDNPPSVDAGVKTTKDLLTEFPDIPEITLVKFQPFSAQGYSGNALELLFTTSASGIGIYDSEYYLSFPVSSVIGQKNSLLRLKIFDNILVAEQEQGSYPLLKQNEIIDRIRQGEITSLDNYPELLTDAEKVKKVSIKSIELIYYPMQNSKLLVPGYKISADIYSESINPQAQINSSTIFLPAAKNLTF